MKESVWFAGLCIELAKTWKSYKTQPARRKDAMCFKMMKYCLRTNKIEEVYQWMVECIQNNKGMAELYVVLEMY